MPSRYVNLSHAAAGEACGISENSDERMVDMIVSNGTLCDEFYEILDALYINSAVVEDIGSSSASVRTRTWCRSNSPTPPLPTPSASSH